MANITAKQVNELRQLTGVGMMDCKKALVECDGDFEKAIDFLRQKGQKMAAKRADRDANEGCVLAKSNGTFGAVVMLSCETDFVARTDNFRGFCNDLARDIFNANPAADANLLDLEFNGEKLEIRRGNLSASTGENIRIGRFVRLVADKGLVSTYRHHDGKGAVAVMVSCEKDDTAAKDEFKDFCSELVLHVYAINPLAISSDGLDANAVAEQRNVCMQKAAESGKPEAMLGRIADGMLNKWFADVALLKQMWQGDGKESVEVKLAQCAKAVSDKLSIVKFSRIVIGEGAAAEEEAAE